MVLRENHSESDDCFYLNKKLNDTKYIFAWLDRYLDVCLKVTK